MKPGFSDSHGGPAEALGVNALRALHDRLLAEKPDDADHDETTCPLCGEEEPPEGGHVETFTPEQLQAAVDKAVAEATAPLQTKIVELEASKEKEATSQQITDFETKIADLETKLDAAVLDATQAKEEKETLQKSWDDEKAAEEEAKTVAARKDERLAKVKEVACFPDEYVEQNADRFAAMSDEDWNARLDEWATLAKKDPSDKDKIPSKTALTAARQETGGDSSSLGLLKEFRRVLVDPRTL